MGSSSREMGGWTILIILFMMPTLVKTKDLQGFVDKEVAFNTSVLPRQLTVLFNGTKIASSSNITKQMGSSSREMGGWTILIILFMMPTLVKTKDLQGFVDKEVAFNTSVLPRQLTVLFNGTKIASSSNITKKSWNDYLDASYKGRLHLKENKIVLKHLRLNDTGWYQIAETLNNGDRQTYEYNLTVSDGHDVEGGSATVGTSAVFVTIAVIIGVVIVNVY